MKIQFSKRVLSLAAAVIISSVFTSPSTAKIAKWRLAWADKVATELTQELVRLCPVISLADESAYDRCRRGTMGSQTIANSLSDYVMWGGGEVTNNLRDRKLSQFGKTVWSSLYLPLFVFSGASKIEIDEDNGIMRLRVEARFRNLLEPGQYPYPFWHASGKWEAYQSANELVFTIDLRDARVLGIQRTSFGEDNPDLNASMGLEKTLPPRKFNKDEWMWEDTNGKIQPKITLFDGIFSQKNPIISDLDTSYRSFAIAVRDNSCLSCHVPTNPEGMGNPILLQTPAHAAGEIDRIVRAVEAGAMPVETWAGPQGIQDEKAKAIFLDAARLFQADFATAKDWEAIN